MEDIKVTAMPEVTHGNYYQPYQANFSIKELK